MAENPKMVSNPLTIIAIFAGITETGGTIVLPLLNACNQKTYMWFLICFPSVLVLVFYLILYTKHHVLYAPSDYKDDASFLAFAFSQNKFPADAGKTGINLDVST